uniref:Transmembrane protein n=1 Tax=Timema bartmani TaxID=61472 RepID=A0A7R9EZL7_9NEOP|nr:unnamed protein product [Timema bartmani]
MLILESWNKRVDHCEKLIKVNWDREMKMDANDRHPPLITNLGDNDDEDESNSGDDAEEVLATPLDKSKGDRDIGANGRPVAAREVLMVVQMATGSQETVVTKSRKRKRNSSKRDATKLKRNSGTAYINVKGTKFEEKRFINIDCGCSKKCIELISEEQRRNRFDSFHKMADFVAKCIFMWTQTYTKYQSNKGGLSMDLWVMLGKKYIPLLYLVNNGLTLRTTIPISKVSIPGNRLQFNMELRVYPVCGPWTAEQTTAYNTRDSAQPITAKQTSTIALGRDDKNKIVCFVIDIAASIDADGEGDVLRKDSISRDLWWLPFEPRWAWAVFMSVCAFMLGCAFVVSLNCWDGGWDLNACRLSRGRNIHGDKNRGQAPQKVENHCPKGSIDC